MKYTDALFLKKGEWVGNEYAPQPSCHPSPLEELRSTADSSWTKRSKNPKGEKMQPEVCPCRSNAPSRMLCEIILGYRFGPEGSAFNQETYESSKFWDIVLEEFKSAMQQEDLTIDYMISIAEGVKAFHNVNHCDGFGKIFGGLLDFGIPSLESIKAGCPNQFHTSPQSMQNPTLTQNAPFSPIAPLTQFQYPQHYNPQQYLPNDLQNHDSSSQPTMSGHVQPSTLLLATKLLGEYLESGFPTSIYHRVLKKMDKNPDLQSAFLDQSYEKRIVWLERFVRPGECTAFVDWKRKVEFDQ